MSPVELPPLASVDDLRAIERVPLADRDIALTTYELLDRAARRWPDRPCTRWIPDAAAYRDNVPVTYGELRDRVHRIAHVLHALGVGRGDAVTLMAPNCSDLLAATLAAEAVGVAAPVNAALDVRHVARIVRLTGSRVLVTAGPELDETLWQRLLDAAGEIGVEVLVALSPDGPGRSTAALETRPGLRTVRLDELVAAQPHAPRALPAVPPAPDDLAAFFHTGGTTGTPKVAAHTHRNQAVMAWSLALATGGETGRAIVAGLPLFHVNALMVTALAPMVTGATAIWPSPLGYRDPQLYAAFWRLVEHYRPHAMSAVPTVYAHLSAVPVDADISSLKLPVVGAAPLSEQVRRAFARATGLELHEGYGLTEATCATSATPAGEVRPGSVGLRFPYQRVVAARVDDATGRVERLPAGAPGELLISGPTVFAGYLRRDGDRRRLEGDGVLVDGWLRTGDLGFVSEERIHLRGRRKDLIIRGGHNIDPAVVEDALLGHPAVTGAAAVGRPDRHSGEVPVAFVTLAAPGTTVEELAAWAARHIGEPAARPKTVTVVDSIPLTEIGKPFKPALRETAAARHFRDVLAGNGVEDVEVRVRHEDGRLVADLTGGAADRAATVLEGYDVSIRTAGQEVTP